MELKPIDVIIETPKGSRQKYHYDEKSGIISLKKILPQGMVFPFDFGFLPGTKGEDGDPLDILVISELTSFPGCQQACRLIGGLKAKQSEEKSDAKKIRNDRFFAISVLSEVYGHIETLNDLPGKIVSETEQFFIQHNKIEGKKFEITGRMKPKDAFKLINKSYNSQ